MSKRTALRIARPARSELLCEWGCSVDGSIQRRRVREKQMADQFLRGLFELLASGGGDLPGGPAALVVQRQPRLVAGQRDQVIHLSLVGQNQVRDDVAIATR